MVILCTMISAACPPAVPPKTCTDAFPCWVHSGDTITAENHFLNAIPIYKWNSFVEDAQKSLNKDLSPRIEKTAKNSDITLSQYAGNPEFLDEFLFDGVLEGKGRQFYKAQEKYGINAIFLIAIARLESACGKSRLARENNNFGGMCGKNGYLKFNSVDDGIDALAKNLKNLYIDKGHTTIEMIGEKYAADPNWADKIVSCMNDMQKFSQIKILKYW